MMNHINTELLTAVRRIYDDVGPPGEYGYGTRTGKALANLYDVYNAALKANTQGQNFSLLEHLARQCAWSERTFGPGERTAGVVDHIRKELDEVLANPTDLSEWIDVVILALDGAWRIGATPEQIIAALVAKQTKNEGRQWPDWRTAAPGKAIEHVRTEGQAA